MKTVRRILSVSIFALIVFFLCGTVSSSYGQEVVKVGAVYPLTGAMQALGKELKNAIELSVDIANGKYPELAPLLLADAKGIKIMKDGKIVPAKIEIEWGNTEGKIETGASEVMRLVRNRKVVAILGCWQSAVTRAAATAAAREQVPIVTQSSAPDLVNSKVMGESLKWLFRPTGGLDEYVEVAFLFLEAVQAKKGLKAETIALIGEDTLSGKQTLGMAKEYIKTKYNHYKIVTDISYPHETSDLVAEVLTLKKANPDVVFASPYLSDSILMTKTFEELQFNPKLGYYFEGSSVVESQYVNVVGKQAEFFLSRGMYNSDMSARKPSIGRIEDVYFKRHGTHMNDNSARAMVKALVLFDAINRAKSDKPDEIRKALLETNIQEAQTNTIYGVKFNPVTHDNLLTRSGIIVQQLRNQVWRTVYPWDFASIDLVWPVPKWSERMK